MSELRTVLPAAVAVACIFLAGVSYGRRRADNAVQHFFWVQAAAFWWLVLTAIGWQVSPTTRDVAFGSLSMGGHFYLLWHQLARLRSTPERRAPDAHLLRPRR